LDWRVGVDGREVGERRMEVRVESSDGWVWGWMVKDLGVFRDIYR
jgi:hypothetical protein